MTLKEGDEFVLTSLLQQKRISLKDIYRVKKNNIDIMTILEERGEIVFEWIDDNGNKIK